MRAQDYRRNRQIRVPEVRLINEKGDQVGIVTTREAQRLADDAQLDLVEVSPTARPPVCKILDFGKFKYETRKRERQSGGRKTSSQLKELRVRPAIDQHDLSYRLEQGKKFLKAGHKVAVIAPQRGEKRKPVEQASVNAQEALARRLAEHASQTAIYAKLAEVFDLDDIPERIEV